MRGFQDGFNGGMVIGLPPVLHFARPELRDRVMKEVLSGEKFISLAITEAFAGSDVAGLKTTARKTEDGKFWIINGTKKWITNGTYVFGVYDQRSPSLTSMARFSDYFTVGCNTGVRHSSSRPYGLC